MRNKLIPEFGFFLILTVKNLFLGVDVDKKYEMLRDVRSVNGLSHAQRNKNFSWKWS